MIKSVLINYIKKLSKKDWREFRKIVHSPYHNQRTDVIRLFTFLEKRMKYGKGLIPEKSEVFAAIFPEREFDEKALRYTFSFLLKILKQYLLQTELEKDAVQQQLYLSQALRQRGLDKYAEKELKSTYDLLDKKGWRNSFYHYQRYLLEQEQLSLTLLQKRSGIANFQSVSEELTVSYISDILRHSCSLLMRQSMTQQSHHLQMLEAAIELVEQSAYGKIPAIAVYFRVYRALSFLEEGRLADSEKEFQLGKQLLEAHWAQFPAQEIREIYLFTINYGIKRLNRGDQQFIREAFELFRSGLEKEALLHRGFLSPFTYKNIVRLGMALQENEWVEHFLEKYKLQLHPRERDNTWRYNLAYFHFQQSNYAAAMRLLQQVEFKDPLNNLDARRMLLRSYFELKEYDALDSLLDSFSTYIYRQKDLGYHKDNYSNLIRFVKKIIHFRGDQEEWKRLEEEVMNTSQVAEKTWLLTQLDHPRL